MKLSKETLAIFKNFSTINSNLTLKSGSKLTTISYGKNIIAEATVAETFPSEFGIYDLNEFLGALSLFENPTLEFNEKHVNIKNEGSSSKTGVTYYAASSNVLTSVPVIKSFPEVDIEFKLPGTMLQQIQKVSSILGVSDFSFVGDGTDILVQVRDKHSTGNTYSAELAKTDKTFRVNFKVENLKLLNGDYTVSIGGKKISRFKSCYQDLTYLIAIELDSSFAF